MIDMYPAGQVCMEGSSHRAGSYPVQDKANPPAFGTAVSLDGDFVVAYDGSKPVLGVVKGHNGSLITVTEIGYSVVCRQAGAAITSGTTVSFNNSGYITTGTDFITTSPTQTMCNPMDTSDTFNGVMVNLITTGSGLVGGSSAQAPSDPVVAKSQQQVKKEEPRKFEIKGGAQ